MQVLEQTILGNLSNGRGYRLMISRTKYELDEKIIRQIFEKAQIGVISDIAPLGAGEFNAVYCAKQGNKEFVLKIAPIDAAPTLKYETNMMEQIGRAHV